MNRRRFFLTPFALLAAPAAATATAGLDLAARDGSIGVAIPRNETRLIESIRWPIDEIRKIERAAECYVREKVRPH